MAVKLYPHNQTAYRNALDMLEKSGRAAVIHPTGTGKSFIAFKFAEEHPDMNILWLAPSEYIFRSQKENYLEAGGEENALLQITFSTYAKLMYGMEELEDAEFAGARMDNTAGEGHEKPDANIPFGKLDCIILDEFHRCGAEGWGRGVEMLLRAYPKALVLGLSATHIRYLDSCRDMAQELFDGHIASRMELGEAIAEGILPAPIYICGLYEYKDELRKVSRRIENHRNIGVRDGSAKLLEKLRNCLQNADGPREIFDRHMKKNGKYIVFCSGRKHMEEMISLSDEWFGGLDADPTIYRAIYDNEESPEEVKKFVRDTSGHLKLLYCIDMLNEGVHVANVDGVVLLRPTASPTLYLQQVGRALSVPDKHAANQPTIFDLVDNFDGLKSIDSFLEEYRKASKPGGEQQKEKKRYKFRLVDEARDSRELFEKLQDCLASSWEVCFAEAEKYRAEYGNLRIPKRYITENGIALGSWLLTQKRVRAGNVPGNLTKEQIEKLDSLGMEWDSRLGKVWEIGYSELVNFYEENGHVDVPSRYVTEGGYPLGKFVSNQRLAWKNVHGASGGHNASKGAFGGPTASEGGASGQNAAARGTVGQLLETGSTSHGRMLTAEREHRLEKLGFIWEKSEYTFERYLAAAKEFYEREGHLDVPVKYVTEDGIALGSWLKAKAAAKETLSEDKVKALEAIGMTWGSRYDARWNEKYRLAEQYYREHGNLDVPKEYKVQGVNLGRWISALRSAKENPENSHYRLDEDRIRQMDAIGMRWTGSQKGYEESWEVRFRLAELYFREQGDLKVSQAYVAEADGRRIWLGKWLAEQRRKHNSPQGKRAMTEEQARRLEKIGMEW